MTTSTYRKRTTLTIEVEVEIVVDVTHDPGTRPSANNPGDPPSDDVENVSPEWSYDAVCASIKEAARDYADEANFSDGTWTKD